MDRMTEHERRMASMSADFVMYRFKLEQCPAPDGHAAEECLFAHPNDPQRRRHPATYQPKFCPHMRARKSCPYGDTCHMAHTLYEQRLHPDRYCVERCAHGSRALCPNPLCFFAHSDAELRPRRTPTGSGGSNLRGGAAQSVFIYQPQPGGVPAMAGPYQQQPQQVPMQLHLQPGGGTVLVPASASAAGCGSVLMVDPLTGLVLPPTCTGNTGSPAAAHLPNLYQVVMQPGAMQPAGGSPVAIYPQAPGGGAPMMVAATAGMATSLGLVAVEVGQPMHGMALSAMRLPVHSGALAGAGAQPVQHVLVGPQGGTLATGAVGAVAASGDPAVLNHNSGLCSVEVDSAAGSAVGAPSSNAPVAMAGAVLGLQPGTVAAGNSMIAQTPTAGLSAGSGAAASNLATSMTALSLQQAGASPTAVWATQFAASSDSGRLQSLLQLLVSNCTMQELQQLQLMLAEVVSNRSGLA